jgi:hypothetical protein
MGLLACGDVFQARELESCEPGVARCGPSGRLVCNPDGRGFHSELCPDQTVCSDGRCVGCATGEGRCGSEGREICEDGTYVAAPCPSESPNCLGAGICACDEGQLACIGGSRMRCSDGVSHVPEPCPGDAPICIADGECGSCVPGSSRCTEAGREVCEDGAGFRLLGCDEDDTCIAGFFRGSGEGYSCVRTRCGAVYCWGRNDLGQLGDPGLGTFSAKPRRVAVGARTLDGSHGSAHACALTENKTVVCWGSNEHAQARLGTPNEPPIVTPGPIALGVPVERVESGTVHNCVIRADSLVQCWGEPLGHKLGWNSSANFFPPVPADQAVTAYLSGAVDLGLSRSTSCALLANQDLVCWGWLWHSPYKGAYGFPPGKIAAGVEAVEGGWYHLVADGPFGPMATGASDCGQCGIIHDFLEIFHLLGLPSGVRLAAGQLNTCALVGANLLCLGDNRHGQLGIGGGCIDDPNPNHDYDHPLCGSPQTSPVVVPLPGPAVDVTVGFGHTCALVETESELVPYCFGEGTFGELGPVGACSSSPVAVPWPPEP